MGGSESAKRRLKSHHRLRYRSGHTQIRGCDEWEGMADELNRRKSFIEGLFFLFLFLQSVT